MLLILYFQTGWEFGELSEKLSNFRFSNLEAAVGCKVTHKCQVKLTKLYSNARC